MSTPTTTVPTFVASPADRDYALGWLTAFRRELESRRAELADDDGLAAFVGAFDALVGLDDPSGSARHLRWALAEAGSLSEDASDFLAEVIEQADDAATFAEMSAARAALAADAAFGAALDALRSALGAHVDERGVLSPGVAAAALTRLVRVLDLHAARSGLVVALERLALLLGQARIEGVPPELWYGLGTHDPDES